MHGQLAYVEMISDRIYDLKAYEEKMIGQLSHCQGSRMTCVKEGRTPRCQNAGQSWPMLMTVHGSEQPTHLLNIEYKTYPDEPSLAGEMPVINVFFSHTLGITEFNELPFLNSETDLNHGYACFRQRAVYSLKPRLVCDRVDWGVRAKGRLIWCEESVNSIDRAGWGEVLCRWLPCKPKEILTHVSLSRLRCSCRESTRTKRQFRFRPIHYNLNAMRKNRRQGLRQGVQNKHGQRRLQQAPVETFYPAKMGFIVD